MTAISVVIPTYNRRPQLERAIASARKQGIEIVVVDDASTDDTSRFLEEASASGVVVERMAINGGPGRARNAGIMRCTGDLILFLDDDDELLPGASDTIASVARERPNFQLYLHNCRHPDGSTTIPVDTPAEELDFAGWVAGRFDGELKPACRRELFEHYQYEDTGASGEGLLWGRVIRDSGAVVSGTPIVFYNSVGTDRLTSAAGLLTRSQQNAHIAQRWLEEFGPDLRRVNPQAWRQRVLAAATYAVTSGDSAGGRDCLRRAGVRGPQVIAVWLLSWTPRSVARAAFLAHRREVLATWRSRRMIDTLTGRRQR